MHLAYYQTSGATDRMLRAGSQYSVDAETILLIAEEIQYQKLCQSMRADHNTVEYS